MLKELIILNEYEGLEWERLVRKHIPNVTDEQCEYILWEKTTFPLGTIEEIEEKLVEYKQKVNG